MIDLRASVFALAGFAVAFVSAPGKQSVPAKPTYSKDIAPILNKRCVSCHSDSRVAPFSLVGYENVRARALTIAKVTELGYMPPWKAKAGYGEFADVPVLTDLEKETIAQWARSGAPEGNPADAPPLPVITPGWRLGTPDLIITPDKPTKIPSDGPDFFRDYLIDPHVTKPTWIRAVDFRPSNKGTVHHVIPQLLTKDEAAKCRKIKFDHDDDSWEQKSVERIDTYGTLGFWSTGAPPFESPDGSAFLVKPGDCILLDMHYKSNGKPQIEKTEVGLYYLPSPPKIEMKADAMASSSIYLQPGESNTRVFLIGQESKGASTIYAVWPHMHYLGRTFKAWVKYPAGYSKPLVCIADWDPDWQLLYYLQTPMVLSKGCKIYVTGTYDNSSNNPRNPHSPPTVVETGNSSKDEMLFLEYYYSEPKGADGKKS